VTYSWGVLHHTGDMWTALENVAGLVKPDGQLWISIYNDQGEASHIWKLVKRSYNKSIVGKFLVLALGVPFLTVRSFVADSHQDAQSAFALLAARPSRDDRLHRHHRLARRLAV
jgi:hypothetical protein